MTARARGRPEAATPTSPPAANLVEVFSSVQGEGTHVGATTVFLRLGECDLRCLWCDSPHTWRPAAGCRFETERGTGRFRSVPNPVSLVDAMDAADALGMAEHAFAAITGGEPLLQPEAVAGLAEAVRERGPRVLLETHGLAVEALEAVVSEIDVVSMDWKFSSDVRRAADPKRGPVADFHAEHERFLSVARAAPEVVVKFVVTPATGDAELDEACARVARTAPEASVIVQPVTPSGGVGESTSAARLLDVVARISRSLPGVRLVPQTHKLYGAL